MKGSIHTVGRRVGVLLALMLFGVSTGFAQAFDAPDYSRELIQRARAIRLFDEREWHLLVHYKRTLFGAYESQEDAPAFFNAPNGKTNPEAELAATIERFFIDPTELKPGEAHPQCDFPARYKWLKFRLSFDPTRLREQPCERLDRWMTDINPQGVTLVFASYFMSSPASMFGHTLLRLDQALGRADGRLLDYSVNFAAAPDTNNPVLYVFRGLFGYFKGQFSVAPYYTRVQDYSNWESRDLWEYPLNLSPDHIDTLLRHLWELGGNSFDYLYFQENCSYHILSVLEVANPELRLTDRFAFHVIPAETVKAVTEQPGLAGNARYRPSLVSQLNGKRVRLSPDETEGLRALVFNRQPRLGTEYQALTDQAKSRVLDAYLDYRHYLDMQASKRPDWISSETQIMLTERSTLPVVERPGKAVEFSSPPEMGHDSARVRLAGGVDASGIFQEIAFRPAYHDLMAKDDGYSPDSQILFGDVGARYYDRSGRLRLQHFRLIDVVSLSPYETLFHRKSFRFGVGIETIRDLDCLFCNAVRLDYGVGVAGRSGLRGPIRIYSLVDFSGESSHHFDKSYRLGTDLLGGMLADIGDRWRFHITGGYAMFPVGHRSAYSHFAVSQRYAISRNLDVRLDLNRVGARREATFGGSVYF
ncbi:MAG TPA: DUF4105 domain-containing protein [Nitrospiria bacterium]|nr:DUF4105 domain-containing protein [Nitrospiria bacterium]